jgi:uncharacterized protein YndB with AHSA1/START domain
MTARSAQHASFTIERVFDAPVAKVYAAFATEQGKSRWFAGHGKWELMERQFDFRVGGRERLKGKWTAGDVTEFDCVYRDIVPEQRIVYTYDMYHNGNKLSVSLATILFKPTAKGTHLSVTEQGVFLDGYDDAGSRERGTRELIERLAASL